MNKWVGIGRLTKDVDLKYKGDLAIGKYTLAVDRKFKKEGQPDADFISCVVFGRSAEFAEKYFSKGMKVAVSGRIQTGSYTAQDGSTRYSTDIVIEEQEFAEKRAQGSVQSVPDGFVPSSTSTTGAREVWSEAKQEELPFD